MLPRHHRLTKTRDFEQLFQKSKSFRANGIVLKTRITKNPRSRFAVVASKKVSLKAVARNRIRRLVSQALGEAAQKIPPGLDAVFIVLPGFKAKNLAEAKNILAPLFEKLFTTTTQTQ